jgi:hypothetical protein
MYINGHAWIHLHGSYIADDSNPYDLCIRFEGTIPPDVARRHAASRAKNHWYSIEGDLKRNSSDNLHEAVFIGPVQFMKSPKSTSSVAVPSLIRLQGLQHCIVDAVDPFNASPPALTPVMTPDGKLAAITRGFRPAKENRELHTFRCNPRIVPAELKSDTVKSRAEVMSDLTSGYTPILSRLAVDLSDADDVPVTISIYPEGVGFAISEVFNFFAKAGDLLVSPVYSEYRAIQRMRGINRHDRPTKAENLGWVRNSRPKARGVYRELEEGG